MKRALVFCLFLLLGGCEGETFEGPYGTYLRGYWPIVYINEEWTSFLSGPRCSTLQEAQRWAEWMEGIEQSSGRNTYGYEIGINKNLLLSPSDESSGHPGVFQKAADSSGQIRN